MNTFWKHNEGSQTFFGRFYNLLLKDLVRIYKLLDKRLRIAIWILGFLMLAQASMELLTIESIRQLGLATGNPQGMVNEIPWKWVFALSPSFAEWTAISPIRPIFLIACYITFVIALKNIITILTMHRTGKDSERISQSIALEIMRRYLYEEYRWHLSKKSAEALQVMLSRSSLTALLVQQLSALTGFLACTVLFIALIVQEPLLSLAIIVFVGSISVFLYMFMRKSVDRCGIEAANAGFEENQAFIAATRGVRDVLIYRQQESFLQALAKALQKGGAPRVFLTLSSAIPSNVLEIAGFTLIPIVILVMGKFGAPLQSIFSAVLLMALTAWRVLPYLNRGVSQMVAIRGLRPQAWIVLDFLYSLRNAPDINANIKDGDQIPFNKSVELKNSSFAYPDSEISSLEGISLLLPKGSLIGVIGPSGAGKSTLCLLLSGLCEPDNGEILVDGKPLAKNDRVAFRKRVSFVPQSPFLIAGSLASNVAFSQWGQPWDEANVLEACRQASIDFIPLDATGILHPIGENGAGLSGGQAQRVSIARALYSHPEIIIFDEATSALDAGNENVIVNSIEKLRGHTTCIIIAHRLSTVERCDIIFWIDHGKVIASGSPEEILPKYKASFDSSLLS